MDEQLQRAQYGLIDESLYSHMSAETSIGDGCAYEPRPFRPQDR